MKPFLYHGKNFVYVKRLLRCRKNLESYLQIKNEWRKNLQNNFVVTDRLVWSQNVGSILDLALQHIEIGKLERDIIKFGKKKEKTLFVCKFKVITK